MSMERKNQPAKFGNNLDGNRTGRKDDTFNLADRRSEQGKDETGEKPVHISQKEAQSIPADKDPDDPVSP